LLALAASFPASALELTFSSRGGWEAIVTNLSNFDGGTQTLGTAVTIVGGVVSTNLQIEAFEGTFSNMIRANAGPGQNYNNWGTGTILRTVDKTPTNNVFARITFPNPVNAFGFNFGVGGCPSYFDGCYPGAASNVYIAPGGVVRPPIMTVQQNSLAFWGLVSDSQTYSFVDIYVTETNRYIVLDDIAQGNYNPAPPPNETAEPGTLLQIAMGVGLLAMARRRMQAATNISL
jgi:hypothetical protein